jgi:integrase
MEGYGNMTQVEQHGEGLLVGDSYLQFLDGIRSKYTKVAYKAALKQFCNFIHMDTDKIITLAGKDNQAALDLLKQYLRYLKDLVEAEKLQPRSMITYFSGIKHFLVMNDIAFNWTKLQKMMPEVTTLPDRAYKKEEIEKMLSVADSREKVVVLLLATNGMRVGALADLQLQHLTPIKNRNKLIAARLLVYPNTSSEYVTIITPECYHAIDRYLDYRVRNHEILTPESPLVRNVIARIPSKADKQRKAKKLSVSSFLLIVHRLLLESGVRKLEDRRRYEVKMDHGFRKFFNVQCKNAGVDPMYKEWLQGRSVGMDDVYHRPDNYEELLLQEYLKVVNSLTFNDAEVLKIENLQLKQKLSKEQGLEKQIREITVRQDAIIRAMQQQGWKVNDLEQVPDAVEGALDSLANLNLKQGKEWAEKYIASRKELHKLKGKTFSDTEILAGLDDP